MPGPGLIAVRRLGGPRHHPRQRHFPEIAPLHCRLGVVGPAFAEVFLQRQHPRLCPAPLRVINHAGATRFRVGPARPVIYTSLRHLHVSARPDIRTRTTSATGLAAGARLHLRDSWLLGLSR